jgi:Calcium-binding EGF domain/IPT/TIG domain
VKQACLVILCAVIAACGDNLGAPSSVPGDAGPPDATVDRCLACAANTVCDATAPAPCSCAAGYAGDGTTAGTGCTDLDECAAGTSTCTPAHGTCTNTDGGFACSCAAGYLGDGMTTGTGCTDIDECATDTSTCTPTPGICTNTDGGFTCGCMAGYTGDGTTPGTGCTDIDECAAGTSDCDNFACVNSVGGFRCDGLYAVGAQEGLLARLDPRTFALLDLKPLTSSGTVRGITAMARSPQSGAVYAVAKIGVVGAGAGRSFGTLDLATGVFSVIAGVDRFSSLAFLPDGTLYAATGANAVAQKTLYTFDPVNGTPSMVGVLAHDGQGEVICYDSDAELMYHWSGSGVTMMDAFSLTAPLTPTSVSTSLGTGEILGCRYLGNHTFLLHDYSSRVHLVTSAGAVTKVPGAVTALFSRVRATLPTTMTVPHTIRPIRGTSAGGTVVTIRGIGLTGATAVSFGDVAAASFTVVDDTTITAVAPAVPAGPAGTVDVTVQGPLPYPATWPAAYTFADSVRAPARTPSRHDVR